MHHQHKLVGVVRFEKFVSSSEAVCLEYFQKGKCFLLHTVFSSYTQWRAILASICWSVKRIFSIAFLWFVTYFNLCRQLHWDDLDDDSSNAGVEGSEFALFDTLTTQSSKIS